MEPIHDELRAQAEIEEEKYREDKEAYKRQKKGDCIPEPTPPPIRLLFLPAKSSSTAIYQVLNENGEQGLMFDTEGGTLASTFGQDFGDFSDSPRTCSDEDFHTAMSISEVLQQHMLRVIKELPSSSSKLATGQAKETLLLKAFWDALPEEFEAKDFKATAQEVGLSIPTSEPYIRQ